jgi:hypothetical protein
MLIFGAVVATRHPDAPIQVVGELSKQEVAEIRVALWRKIHPPILPDFSARSLLGAPRRLLEQFTMADAKVWRIEARTHGFVAVIARAPASPNGEKFIFWSVFRGTNCWRVEHEYRLRDY